MIEIILKLIENAGITNNKLLSDLNLPLSAISEWKKGKAKPSVEALVKIADYFGVSVDYILGRTNTTTEINSRNTITGTYNVIGNNSQISIKDNLTEQEKALFNIFKKLDVVKQAQLLAYAAELKKE